MAHAKLSPSKAYQWSSCTSSVGLVADLIKTGRIPQESGGNAASKRGTERHAKAADILQGKDVVLSKEETTPIMAYVEHCRRCSVPSSTVYTEQPVPLIYSPQETGTVDFCSVNPTSIIINDYKDGEGVQEVAFENKQLAIYALSMVDWLTGLGIYEFPEDRRITLCIVQPNFRGYEGPDAWVTTLGELRKFYSEQIAVGIFEIEQGITQFRPDPEDACIFCRAQNFCKAYQTYLMKDIPELDCVTSELVPVPETVLPPVDALTETQIGRILGKADEVISWLSGLKTLALDRLNAGETVAGWKLVQGRPGNRAWTDEEVAAKLLKNYLATDEIYEKSVISPTKAEKLLKPLDKSARFQNKLDSLVSRSPGKPTLAPENDPRPAISLKVLAEGLPTLPETPASLENLGLE